MKIYYKKRFYSGLGSFLLGLALPVTCLIKGWERFEVKDAFLTGVLVFIGLSEIGKSLNREKARRARDEDRDERDRWIDLRSKAVSYQVLLWLDVAGLLRCLVGDAMTHDPQYIQMAVPYMLLLIAAGVTRLVSEIYYEVKE